MKTRLPAAIAAACAALLLACAQAEGTCPGGRPAPRAPPALSFLSSEPRLSLAVRVSLLSLYVSGVLSTLPPGAAPTRSTPRGAGSRPDLQSWDDGAIRGKKRKKTNKPVLK